MVILEVEYSGKFKKSFKKAKKRGKNTDKLVEILQILQEGKNLPIKYKDHKLTGNYKNYKECHIEPDWLLIYKIEDNILKLADTGSHADLFG
jgi:mRNA interferase YafQ